MLTLLVILLLLAAIGAYPAWPYSSAWGEGPTSVLFIAAVVVLVLLLMGRP